MNERIYMSAPDVGATEEAAVVRAMQSGWVAPLGPEVDAFERELADRLDVPFAVALNSGTSALHLGLLALGVKPGDTVVTSTMTFAATTNAIVYTGATPFFIDCLPGTANIDPALLDEGLARLAAEGKKVAAIVPVDMLGKAIDYSSVIAIAEKYGIPVLADAAESLGATHNNKPAGSFGEASILSFNGNKIMTTSGGGMLLTHREEIAQHVRYLGTQARQPVTHYEHTEVGYNYRLSNVLAALGRAQLARLDSMIARRRSLRDKYKAFFASVPGVSVFGTDNDVEDNVWLTSIQIDQSITGWSLDDFSRAMQAENIETRPIWKPMHLQPVFSHYQGIINGVAEQLFGTCHTLPSGSSLTDSDHDRIFNAMTSFLEKA